MKSFPLGKDQELSVLWPTSLPRKNFWAQALKLELGTMASFSLSDTPAVKTECSVTLGGNQQPETLSACLSWHGTIAPKLGPRQVGPSLLSKLWQRPWISLNSHNSPYFLSWQCFKSLIRHCHSSTIDTYTDSFDINRMSQFTLFLPTAIRMSTFINYSLLTTQNSPVNLV